MRDPVTIKLSRPIDVIDQHFEELKVREPTGDDLMAAGDQTEGYPFIARVAAACASIPFEAFQRLRGYDATALTIAITDFLKRPDPEPVAGRATITITFEPPVTAAGQTLAEVTVHDLTGIDLIAAADGDGGYAHMARLAARCSTVTLETLRAMPAREAMMLTDAVIGFLGDATPRGSATSTSRSHDGGATRSHSS